MRIEKGAIVAEIKKRVEDSPFVLVTDYTGLKVDQFSELRTRLAGVGAEYRVVKNTLLRRALQEVKLPEIDTDLTGQTAVVLGEKDVSAAAKILKNFSAEFKKPSIKSGILDAVILSKQEILDLADLPSREVMLAKLLGLLNAPASTFVRLLNTPASQLAQVLKAKSEKE